MKVSSDISPRMDFCLMRIPVSKGPGRGGDAGPYIQVNTHSKLGRWACEELKKIVLFVHSQKEETYTTNT